MPDATDNNTKPKTLETQLQDSFLQALEDRGRPVSIYLVNGIKLQGVIGAFDRHTIALLPPPRKQGSQGNDVATQLVFKHAMSTIVPDPEFDLLRTLQG